MLHATRNHTGFGTTGISMYVSNGFCAPITQAQWDGLARIYGTLGKVPYHYNQNRLEDEIIYMSDFPIHVVACYAQHIMDNVSHITTLKVAQSKVEAAERDLQDAKRNLRNITELHRMVDALDHAAAEAQQARYEQAHP